jgi:hypothetical protein
MARHRRVPGSIQSNSVRAAAADTVRSLKPPVGMIYFKLSSLLQISASRSGLYLGLELPVRLHRTFRRTHCPSLATPSTANIVSEWSRKTCVIFQTVPSWTAQHPNLHPLILRHHLDPLHFRKEQLCCLILELGYAVPFSPLFCFSAS